MKYFSLVSKYCIYICIHIYMHIYTHIYVCINSYTCICVLIAVILSAHLPPTLFNCSSLPINPYPFILYLLFELLSLSRTDYTYPRIHNKPYNIEKLISCRCAYSSRQRLSVVRGHLFVSACLYQK